MKTEHKHINIFWRLKQTAFAEANKTELIESVRRIGSNRSAVSRMLRCGDEMKVLLPSILGFEPTDHNWSTRVKYYWDSISEGIGETGRRLNIGFNYDVNDDRVIKQLEILKKDNKIDIKTDDQIILHIQNKVDIVMKDYHTSLENNTSLTSVDKEAADKNSNKAKEESLLKIEEMKYKFGLPIIVEDYLLYRYCLSYKDVANTVSDVNNSPNIRFYLYSEDQLRADKRQQQKLELQAIVAYNDIVADRSKVEDVLYVLGKGRLVESAKDETDKQIALSDAYKANFKLFITTVRDKNLTFKGEIEKLISKSILRRIPNTQTVVSAQDATLVLGNTLEDAVTFFSNEVNKQKINEFRASYKALR